MAKKRSAVTRKLIKEQKRSRRKETLVKRKPELLLCPNIPKPMHGLAPRVVLGQSWWDKTRKESYKSNYYHCLACGVHKLKARYRQWLEGHEVYETDYLLGRHYYVETVPLCHLCHNYVHSGRLEALREEGKITHAKYRAVIEHGDSVLHTAGLRAKQPYEGPTAEWGDWRLVVEVDGTMKEYKPLYNSFDEWRKAHTGYD